MKVLSTLIVLLLSSSLAYGDNFKDIKGRDISYEPNAPFEQFTLWEGKSPFEKFSGIDLFENRLFRHLLLKAVGEKRAKIILNYCAHGQASGVERKGDCIQFSVCKSGACETDHVSVEIDMKKHSMLVIYAAREAFFDVKFEVKIGVNAAKVYEALGKPQSVKRITTANGKTETWTYTYPNRSLTFENGILTMIEELM